MENRYLERIELGVGGIYDPSYKGDPYEKSENISPIWVGYYNPLSKKGLELGVGGIYDPSYKGDPYEKSENISPIWFGYYNPLSKKGLLVVASEDGLVSILFK